MKSNEEILGEPDSFDNQMRQDTWHKGSILKAMKEAQIEALKELIKILLDSESETWWVTGEIEKFQQKIKDQ